MKITEKYKGSAMGFPQNDDLYNYKYFIMDGRTPIRKVLDKQHHTVDAEGFDAEKGIFFGSASLLNDINTHPYIDRVTATEFYALCESLSKKASPEPGGYK